DGREKPKVDVHGLIGPRAGVDRLEMTAGDVIEQRAVRRGWRRRRQDLAASFGGGETPRQQTDRSRFNIALAAGDLAGETQPRHGVETQSRVEKLRRVEEGVAVQPSEPRKLGPVETGDAAEDTGLLAVPELGLKAYDVEQSAKAVVLAQLHHGVRLRRARMRVGEAKRLHRSVAQRLAPALGHHLDRQAAVEIRRRLPLVERDLVAGEKCIDERI